jgi:3-methyladenine DNA glycosylase AlkD
MDIKAITLELESLGNAEDAAFLQRYFKTGPGQYGEGDIFRGIRVPVLRKLSKRYETLALNEVEDLLKSGYHEDRLAALLILVRRFSKADEEERERIFTMYLCNTRYINNWDLVDLSAGQIVGCFLANRDRSPLKKLAESRVLWERRIAIISTSHYIKSGDFADTIKIAEMLLNDTEDLIHKAVGWMLREVGKRSVETAEVFLADFYRRMPRTMLRYAIERFAEPRRRAYLKGEI